MGTNSRCYVTIKSLCGIIERFNRFYFFLLISICRTNKLEFFFYSFQKVEPVAPQRVGPAPMYMYQNMPHPNQSTLPASLSMAGTLPIRSIPVSRLI